MINKIMSLLYKKIRRNASGYSITNELLDKVETSGYFDSQWYSQSNPDIDFAKIRPSRHFLEKGYLENRDPSLTFSLLAYLNANPDVAVAKLNPLVHFVLCGKAEGRLAYPVSKSNSAAGQFAAASLSEAQIQQLDILVNSNWFDNNWYLNFVNDKTITPELAARHYLLIGASLGEDPSPLFSTQFYADSYPDVVKSGVNPLVHYLTAGMTENRKIQSSKHANKVADEQAVGLANLTASQKAEFVRVEKSKWFNPNWYVDTYSELDISSDKAVEHYCLFGWKEEKDPGPLFSTSFYLMCHSDIASSSLNPLLHYINHGNAEKRAIVPSKYARLDVAGNLSSYSEPDVLACDFTNFRELEKPLQDTPLENTSDLCSLSFGSLILGEVEQGSLATFQTQTQLFESLWQSYKVDNKLVNAWLKATDLNLVECLNDISIVNSQTLRIRFESANFINQRVLAEAYQFDINQQIVKKISSVTCDVTSLNFVDISLHNQFLPVLMVFKSGSQIILSQLFPFPSLLRGGKHFGELCVQSSRASLNERFTVYTKELLVDYSTGELNPRRKHISISVQNVIGNEHIFDRSFMTWIQHYFNIFYSGWAETPQTPLETQRLKYLSEFIDISYDTEDEDKVNALSRDALPTLKLVTNLAANDLSQGPEIIVPEALTVSSAKVVTLSSLGNSVADTWYSQNSAKFAAYPSSVMQRSRQRDDNIELIASARDQINEVLPEISVSMSILLIIKDSNQLHQARLWQTIKNQKGITELDIVLGLDHSNNANVYLPAEFSDHSTVVNRKSGEPYKDFYLRCVTTAKYERITHTVESAMFYDDCSLAVLGATISNEVKCSSCRLINKTVRGKGYRLTPYQNALSVIRESVTTTLSSPSFELSYYPANQNYSVVAFKPLVVTFEKQKMLEFIPHCEPAFEADGLFVEFGVYLVSRDYKVLFSNHIAVGLDIEEQDQQQNIKLSAASIALVNDITNKVAERRRL